MLCHTWIYWLTYQKVTLLVQFLTRGMHLISILLIFLTFWNIPTASAYGTYISQLIRYSRTCCNYDSFSSRHFMLAEGLMRTFYKFMGRYPELVSKFNKSQSSMICDGWCSHGSIIPYLPSVDEIVIGAGVVHKAGHAYSSGHLMPSLINIS